MKTDELLKKVRVPAPDPALRHKILSEIYWVAARSETPERVPAGKTHLWAAGIAACLVFLFLWNPRLPGSQLEPTPQQLSRRSLTVENVPQLSAQLRKKEILQALREEHL